MAAVLHDSPEQLSTSTDGGFNFKDLQVKFDNWMKEQHPAVEVAVTAIGASVQGAFLGYLLGSFTSMDPAVNNPNASPEASAQLKMLQAGGPWAQARNLAVMTGVNAGVGLALKKARGGKEDVWNAMGAAFCAGACFSVVSGMPNPAQNAITTGVAFAAFNGVFYQIAKAFSGDPVDDLEYERAKYVLNTLGLERFEGNLKKNQLTDSTIMLWNDSALQEAQIPPGPRLLILHHVDTFRNPSSVLKPALPVPYPPASAKANH